MKTNLYRTLKLISLACLFLALLCGCNVETDLEPTRYGSVDYDDVNVMAFKPLKGIPENISVREYAFDLKYGWELGGIAEAGASIFYLNQKMNDHFEILDKCDLVKIDIQSGKETVEYSFDTSKHLFVNELTGTKEDVFWVELGEDWKIKRYNLTSKELSTVRESDDWSQPILLSSGDNYISWFETLPDERTVLYAYDIEQDKIKVISDELTSLSSRAHIQESIITFVTKSDGNYIVNTYDLKTEEFAAQIDVGQKYIDDSNGNREYLTWCFEPFYGNIDLYAYDIERGEVLQFNRKEDFTDVFSYHIINHLILINDRDTDNILCLDMKNGTKSNLTAGLGDKHSYFFGQVTPNLSYIATERGGGQKKIVRIDVSDAITCKDK